MKEESHCMKICFTVWNRPLQLFLHLNLLLHIIEDTGISRFEYDYAGKSMLTFSQLEEREIFCLANLKEYCTTFHDMMNVIHEDIELTKNSRQYCLLLKDKVPHESIAYYKVLDISRVFCCCCPSKV